jgi:hypothetical protein
VIRAWAALLVTWLALAPVPALALQPKPGPDAEFVLEIETALLAFRDYYRRWPTTVGELRGFATKTGRPLDLSKFSNLDFARTSDQTIIVQYITHEPNHEEGAFAISVHDISRSKR